MDTLPDAIAHAIRSGASKLKGGDGTFLNTVPGQDFLARLSEAWKRMARKVRMKDDLRLRKLGQFSICLMNALGQKCPGQAYLICPAMIG